jgi:hypothetical protein
MYTSSFTLEAIDDVADHDFYILEQYNFQIESVLESQPQATDFRPPIILPKLFPFTPAHTYSSLHLSKNSAQQLKHSTTQKSLDNPDTICTAQQDDVHMVLR